MATRVICDLVIDNSVFIHHTCQKELPHLKQLLENKAHEPQVIKKRFEWIERQFEFLWAEFNRYQNCIDKIYEL